MKTRDMNLELAQKIAVKAVRGAGKILMANFDKEKRVSFKGPRNMVTHVDLESEKFILNLIEKNFSDHSILSEEAGMIDKKSEYIWVTDPIDGTVNYYHGMDPFCVGLSLLKNDEILINAIYNPNRDQLYFAEKGKGTTLNGKVIKVSDRKMNDSIVMLYLSSKKEKRDRIISVLEKIYEKGGHVRMSASGLSQIAYVAAGTCEAFFSIERTDVWDILPAALLVKEAGGKVTDIKGNELNLKSESVLATNGIVHEEMLEFLKAI